MVEHLSVSLRKQSFYINKTDADFSYAMKNYHLHNDYEIFYLVEGERIYLINGKRYVVQENSLVFIDKNVIHKTITTDIPRYKRIVINFRNSLLTDDDQFLLYQLFEKGPSIVRLSSNKKQELHQLISRLQQEYMADKDDAIIYIRSLLLQLLIESKRLLEKQHSISITDNDDNFGKREITEIIKYINNHFSKDLSLFLLSKHFHLSEQYISRLFRRVTGSTIISYLNAVRVNEAKRLLLESNMKVTEISKRVGYSNNVHLWRMFKKLTGNSPKEYRSKLYREE